MIMPSTTTQLDSNSGVTTACWQVDSLEKLPLSMELSERGLSGTSMNNDFCFIKSSNPLKLLSMVCIGEEVSAVELVSFEGGQISMTCFKLRHLKAGFDFFTGDC